MNRPIGSACKRVLDNGFRALRPKGADDDLALAFGLNRSQSLLESVAVRLVSL